jgi:SAM-dependent methyltransferase
LGKVLKLCWHDAKPLDSAWGTHRFTLPGIQHEGIIHVNTSNAMHDLDLQLNYWNTVGLGKPFRHPVDLDRLNQLLSPGSRILDFGCGYGRVLGFLQGAGFTNLVGFDPAPAMVDQARGKFPGISFQVLEAPPHLPLPDASVDAVLLISVLTCVPTDDGQTEVMREAHRVLAAGGILYISDLWLQTDERNIERYARGVGKYGIYGVFDLPEGVTVRHHDRRWIETLTSQFEVLSLDETQVTTMNGHSAHGFQWFGRKPSAV